MVLTGATESSYWVEGREVMSPGVSVSNGSGTASHRCRGAGDHKRKTEAKLGSQDLPRA